MGAMNSRNAYKRGFFFIIAGVSKELMSSLLVMDVFVPHEMDAQTHLCNQELDHVFHTFLYEFIDVGVELLLWRQQAQQQLSAASSSSERAAPTTSSRLYLLPQLHRA